PTGQGGPGGAGARDTLSSIGSSLNTLMSTLQAADAAPTTQLAAAVAERQKALAELLGKWATLRSSDLAGLNAVLKAAGLPVIALER
ncbi:MAG TPA: hypothetical protein VLJ16_01860, partial [Acidobacteriota bacterium]|nr:hypothetical protein [Acidobacteriota bacterium]